jgi:hypothetical protein
MRCGAHALEVTPALVIQRAPVVLQERLAELGLAGASAGALSGVVVSAWGYPLLALAAAIATVPLIVLGVAIRVELPKESAV